MSAVEFEPWPKTPRLFRDAVITEKLDGTNAAVGVKRVPLDYDLGAYTDRQPVIVRADQSSIPEGEDTPTHVFVIYAQSRKRFVTPDGDNQGFAAWVWEHAAELANELGEGLHFGEWWGQGIQRGYGLTEKRFSLFNTSRWAETDFTVPGLHVVPTLFGGPFGEAQVRVELLRLEVHGSAAAPGFRNPEGVCVSIPPAARFTRC